MKPELVQNVEELQSKSNVYTTSHSGNNYSVIVPGLTDLTDGYPLSVKFDAASTGPITITPDGLGAKSVIDYFGNSVTNVRKNLIANLRYEATSDSFTLLGKGGGGNAIADQLLLNAKATVDSGPITGTMPNYSNLGKSPTNIESDGEGNLFVRISTGYYDSLSLINIYDANFVSMNLKKGEEVLGLQGAFNDIASYEPGNNICSINSTVRSSSSFTYEKAFDTQILRGGKVRVSFDLRVQNNYVTYAQIYKNGVPYGTERSTLSTSYVTFTEDLDFAANDHIQVYIKVSNDISYPQLTNFKIGIAQTLFATTIS